MAINRSLMERQLRMGGGIINVMPRQQYGLGSFVKKAVKGVTGAVKGVVNTVKENPALALAALNFAPMLAGGSPFVGFGKGRFAGSLFNIPGASSVSNFFEGKDLLSKGNVAAGIIGLTSFLAAQGADEQEIEAIQRDPEKLSNYLGQYYKNLNPSASPQDVANFVRVNTMEYRSNGGRMGFAGGTEFEEYLKGREKFNKQQNIEQLYKEFLENKRRQQVAEQKTMAANGGRIGYALGDRAENNAMQASGIMNLPLNQNPAGVTELDLRDSGGFIPPVGVKEKADDIPAMLSNNEFVFTADAVRGMGDGDVNKGAERMYSMMKTLENGGRV